MQTQFPSSACTRLPHGPLDAELQWHPASSSALIPAPHISHGWPFSVGIRLQPSPRRLTFRSSRIETALDRPACVCIEVSCKSLGNRATCIYMVAPPPSATHFMNFPHAAAIPNKYQETFCFVSCLCTILFPSRTTLFKCLLASRICIS